MIDGTCYCDYRSYHFNQHRYFRSYFVFKKQYCSKNRTLKERYYTRYIDALHDLASKNTSFKNHTAYTKARDELLIIANEQVITALLLYEEKAVGQQCDRHDEYLTSLITAIRKDLKLKDKNFPMIRLVK